MYHSFLTHSSADGHLGCYHVNGDHVHYKFPKLIRVQVLYCCPIKCQFWEITQLCNDDQNPRLAVFESEFSAVCVGGNAPGGQRVSQMQDKTRRPTSCCSISSASCSTSSRGTLGLQDPGFSLPDSVLQPPPPHTHTFLFSEICPSVLYAQI